MIRNYTTSRVPSRYYAFSAFIISLAQERTTESFIAGRGIFSTPPTPLYASKVIVRQRGYRASEVILRGVHAI